MEYKVIEWTPKRFWLVAVTGKDGSYTPVIELHKDGNGNQVYRAAQLLSNEGFEALRNPHALIGKSCGCGSCFCCAALEVLTAANKLAA